jgi:effector-binding domain-containing protein
MSSGWCSGQQNMNTSSSITHSIVEQPEQSFVGITRTLPMSQLSEAADEMPRLFDWLQRRGHIPDGPPFLRYLVIDMAADMVVQAGVPLRERVAGDGEVEAGVLPAGRYVTAVHVGPYEALYEATTELLRWAEKQHLRFDTHPSPAGEVWGSRLEWYETNPSEQPDPTTWVTRLAFRLAN